MAIWLARYGGLRFQNQLRRVVSCWVSCDQQAPSRDDQRESSNTDNSVYGDSWRVTHVDLMHFLSPTLFSHRGSLRRSRKLRGRKARCGRRRPLVCFEAMSFVAARSASPRGLDPNARSGRTSLAAMGRDCALTIGHRHRKAFHLSWRDLQGVVASVALLLSSATQKVKKTLRDRLRLFTFVVTQQM
jgi:hypothetical protein